MGCLAEMYRRRGLKAIVDKAKTMVLNGEEGLDWGVKFAWMGCDCSMSQNLST